MTSNQVRLRVVEVVPETDDAHSLVLEPVIAETPPIEYQPGQFLTLRIPTDRSGGAARCYSLCSSPIQDEPMKVTVKRTKDGYGSNWICDNLTAGDEIDALRPAGTFTPRSLDDDLVLLAGGSGVTPVMSILKSALAGGTASVTLIYANRDERSVIFREELMALTAAYPRRLNVVHWLESVQGVPSAEGLRALLDPHRERTAFICGPAPFMDLAVQVLGELGVVDERVNVERFTSLAGDPFAAGVVEIDADAPTSMVEVTLDGVTTTLEWPQRNNLLEVLLAAGLDAPYSCREGACSACACVLLEGEVTLQRNEVLDDQDLGDGLILGCQALPTTDRLRITYDS